MQVVYTDGCFDVSSLVGPQKSTSGEPEKVDLFALFKFFNIRTFVQNGLLEG